MTKIEQARQFAHEAHDSIGQKRKYTGEPYWVHTDEVARIIADLPLSPLDSIREREDMVCAAHCHDIVEDVMTASTTPRRYDLFAIADLFGEVTAKLVSDLTDEYTKEAWPDLNRAKRKQLERERISKTSPAAKTIKLADLISNSRSIVAHDKDFARIYLKEKYALLPYLADGSPILLQKASMQTLDGFKQLGIDVPILSGTT